MRPCRAGPGIPLLDEGLYLSKLASFHSSGDEVAQQGNGTLGSGPVLRFRRGLPGEAGLARLGDACGLHRAERYAPRSARGSAQEDPALSAGGSDPDPEPAHCGIPDGIFPLAGPQARHGGTGEAHAFRSCHGLLPERPADDFCGIGDHAVGEVGILEGGLGARMTEQASDGEDCHALPERDAGMRMSKIVKTHVGQSGLGAEPAPETVEARPSLAIGFGSGPRRPRDPPSPGRRGCRVRAATARRFSDRTCYRAGTGVPSR